MGKPKQIYNKIYDKDKYDKVNKETKDLIEDYILELKSQKKAAGTILQYSYDLKIIAIYAFDYCNNKSLLELSKRDIRNFVLHCSDEWNMSNARVNRIMSALRTILSFAEDDDEEYEEYDRNVAAKVKGLPKEKVREITFISDEVLLNLYNKFMNEKRYREATLLAILYESGCRKNEILQVERATITKEGNATNKVRGKRGKIFPVLYFNKTKEAFEEYNKTRTDDNPMLFITGAGNPATAGTLYEIVVKWERDLYELTGEEYRLDVHTFRHCYIENMVNGTHWLCRDLKLGEVRLDQVKSLVHHSDISTTDGYRSDNEERDIENLFGIKLS